MDSASFQNLTDLYKSFPPVKIDEGVFKYIIIKGTWHTKARISDEEIYFIRGWKDLEFHADNFARFRKEFENSDIVDKIAVTNEKKENVKLVDGVIFECPGGGRIDHKPNDKTVFIYGYSQSFGRGDHTLAKKMIEQAYPAYPADKITWSNDGY
jgi:phosphohistidine phosphatase